MEIVIGIDAGGTKTNFVAYQENGEVLKKVAREGANLANDRERAIDTLMSGLKELLHTENWTVKQIIIGMAGVVRNPLVPLLMETIEKQYHARVTIYNDVVFAHKAIFKNKDGILLSSGTGSIAIVKAANETEYQIVGGYGHLFGDEASGYDIARLAVVYCTEQHDFGKSDAFTTAILRELAVENIRDAVPYLYRATKGEVAQLAQTVAELELAGNETAKMIILQSAKAYVDHLITVIKTKSYQVKEYALWGSVFQNNKTISQYIHERLADELNLKEIEATAIEVTVAALYE